MVHSENRYLLDFCPARCEGRGKEEAGHSSTSPVPSCTADYLALASVSTLTPARSEGRYQARSGKNPISTVKECHGSMKQLRIVPHTSLAPRIARRLECAFREHFQKKKPVQHRRVCDSALTDGAVTMCTESIAFGSISHPGIYVPDFWETFEVFLGAVP